MSCGSMGSLFPGRKGYRSPEIKPRTLLGSRKLQREYNLQGFVSLVPISSDEAERIIVDRWTSSRWVFSRMSSSEAPTRRRSYEKYPGSSTMSTRKLLRIKKRVKRVRRCRFTCFCVKEDSSSFTNLRWSDRCIRHHVFTLRARHARSFNP